MPPPKKPAKSRKKKRKKIAAKKLIWLALPAFGIVGAILFKMYLDDNFIRYGKPGILIPEIYQVHGIDVSHHQGNIKWKGVEEMAYKDITIKFVFMKATQGALNRDPRFRHNWRNAGRHEIPRGAYHYFLPSVPVAAQINNFSRQVKLVAGDLPPVLDVEQTDGVAKEELQKRVKQWLTAAENIYGVKPILYTYASFYKDYLSPEFDDYPLWIAHYALRTSPGIDRDWHFWQLSDRSNIDGISTFVDFNVFNGDANAFQKMRIK